MAPVYLGTRERAWRGFENRRPVGMQISMQPNLPKNSFLSVLSTCLRILSSACQRARARKGIRLHYRWPDPER